MVLLMMLVRVVLTAVRGPMMVARFWLSGEEQTGRRHTSGTQDEGTTLADRRRHVAGGHDDTYREAEKNQPDQFASRGRIDVGEHGFANTVRVAVIIQITRATSSVVLASDFSLANVYSLPVSIYVAIWTASPVVISTVSKSESLVRGHRKLRR